MLTRMARSACALTACEPFGELTWKKLTLACSPSRGTDGLCAFGRSAGLPGRRAGIPAKSRSGQRTGSAHRAGSQDHLPIGEGSVIGHAHRTGVVGRDRIRLGYGYPGSSCRVLGWSSRWRWESMALGPAGVWRTQKGQINLSRPGPRSLQWSQAGTAGLREYRPHNQGKARRGNRDSEGPSKQRPRARLCDPKSLRLG